MDYGKLSKQALLEMCDAKGIAYSSTFTKDKLIELLFEAEKQAKQTTQSTPSTTKFKPKKEVNPDAYVYNGVTKAGAIVSIVFASIGLLLTFNGPLWLISGLIILLITGDVSILMFGLFFSIFFIIGILSIVYSAKLLKGTLNSKLVPGIFGIITGFVGGILIFVGKYLPPGSDLSELTNGEEEPRREYNTLTKVSAILAIISTSFILLIASFMFVLVSIWTVGVLLDILFSITHGDSINYTFLELLGFAIFWLTITGGTIFLIVTLIMLSRLLKGKLKSKKVVGIMSIFTSGLWGILILCGEYGYYEYEEVEE